MVRRRRRLLAVAVSLAALGVAWNRAPSILEHRLERELTSFFGRETTIGSVALGLVPLQGEVRDLVIAGSEPGQPPFLEVRRATVVPALRRLFEDGRLTLWRLVLEAPTIRVRTFAQGGDDLPKLRPGKGGGLELDIRRLIVEEGELVLDERKVPFRLDLPGLAGRLGTPPGGGLAGQLTLGPGPIRFGSAPPMSLSAELDLLWRGNVVQVHSARLRTDATDVHAAGRVDVKPLTAHLAVSGPVDLALADAHILRTGFGLAGTAEYRGTAQLAKGKFSFTGRLEGTAGRFDGELVPRYAGQVAWGPDGTRLRGFAVQALGGEATLDVDVPPAPGRARVAGTLRRVDAEALARYVFDWGELGLGGAATGPLDVDWPRGVSGRTSGRTELVLDETRDGRRTPLSGKVRWSAVDGVQSLHEVILHTPHTAVDAAGTVGRSREADIAVAVDSRDLEAADILGARLRRAVGARRPEVAEVAGAGRFTGQWRGTLDEPVVTGHLAARPFRYLGVGWGELDWSGTLSTTELRSSPALLRRGESSMRITGTSFTGATPDDDRLDLAITFERWPAADFRVALESDLELDGLLSGTTRFSGTALEPWGTATVQSRSGTWAGIRYDDLEVESDLRGALTYVRAGTARVGGGRVAFRGSVTATDDYDGEGEAHGVAVEALAAVFAPGQPWGGHVSGRGQLRGTLEMPHLEATVTSPRLFYGDEGVGALDMTLRGAGDGLVTTDLHLRSGRLDVTAAGRIGLASPWVADLRLTTRGTSLDPYLRAAAPALPHALGIIVTGDAALRGPLADVAALQATVEVHRLNVVFPGYPVSNVTPLHLALDKGRLGLTDVRLAGEGTDLQVEGSIGLLPREPVDLRLAGAADLRALASIVPGLRGRGAARLQMEVGGPASVPRIAGTVELAGAGLRVRGFPHGLEDLRGTVRFSERHAQWTGVSGTLGGGDVEVGGTASYTPSGLQSFDVRASGRALSLRYPEGLRSTIDAELRFFGDPARRWVMGSVDVRQAHWTRRYDVASELLGRRDAVVSAGAGGEGALLDVRVSAPGTLRVDNNLAALQARADLSVRGTTAAPVILGRAEVERGRVYFQGTTYVIRRGTIDFANPQQTDPVFDIEAEARVRSYRITLDVDGTLDRVFPVLSSDPPLSPVQIVSLLAGADEDTVSSLTQGTLATRGDAPGARLAAAGAATLAAGRLSEEMGLERGAERLFGLNRFSIDPSLVRGGVQNPSARLTMGKRVTPDLNVLYSIDLRGTEERLLAVEYTVSDRLSLLLTRAEPGGFGFDLRVRQSR